MYKQKIQFFSSLNGKTGLENYVGRIRIFTSRNPHHRTLSHYRIKIYLVSKMYFQLLNNTPNI